MRFRLTYNIALLFSAIFFSLLFIPDVARACDGMNYFKHIKNADGTIPWFYDHRLIFAPLIAFILGGTIQVLRLWPESPPARIVTFSTLISLLVLICETPDPRPEAVVPFLPFFAWALVVLHILAFRTLVSASMWRQLFLICAFIIADLFVVVMMNRFDPIEASVYVFRGSGFSEGYWGLLFWLAFLIWYLISTKSIASSTDAYYRTSFKSLIVVAVLLAVCDSWMIFTEKTTGCNPYGDGIYRNIICNLHGENGIYDPSGFNDSVTCRALNVDNGVVIQTSEEWRRN